MFSFADAVPLVCFTFISSYTATNTRGDMTVSEDVRFPLSNFQYLNTYFLPPPDGTTISLWIWNEGRCVFCWISWLLLVF